MIQNSKRRIKLIDVIYVIDEQINLSNYEK